MGKRQIEIRDGVGWLPLTQGYFAQIDVADIPLVDSRSWHVCLKGLREYVACTVQSKSVKRKVMLHRFLMGITDPEVFVDHVDGDGLNNRRSNLRIATRPQNLQNQELSSRNTSGYKGVRPFRNTRRGRCPVKLRWMAQIKLNGVQKRLGIYNTPEQAAKAYDKAAVEMFGEFAKTNKMMGLID